MPPYLCAQWSINDDPGGVSDIIKGVVVQEMYHFALAGNMLTAIGGMPGIDNAAFLPGYPTHALPGGIPQQLAVDLKPLTPLPPTAKSTLVDPLVLPARVTVNV